MKKAQQYMDFKDQRGSKQRQGTLVVYIDVKKDKNSPMSLLESRVTTVPKKCYFTGNERMVETGKDL